MDHAAYSATIFEGVSFKRRLETYLMMTGNYPNRTVYSYRVFNNIRSMLGDGTAQLISSAWHNHRRGTDWDAPDIQKQSCYEDHITCDFNPKDFTVAIKMTEPDQFESSRVRARCSWVIQLDFDYFEKNLAYEIDDYLLSALDTEYWEEQHRKQASRMRELFLAGVLKPEDEDESVEAQPAA